LFDDLAAFQSLFLSKCILCRHRVTKIK
jgi:hypothetical protein